MHDVMVKPELDRAAEETAVVTKFYFYHDEDRKKAARATLRRIGESKAYKSEDGMADVALEEIWNALLNN